jgi:hypothetical protein
MRATIHALNFVYEVQEDSGDAGFQKSLKKAKAILIITPGVDRAVALAEKHYLEGILKWSANASLSIDTASFHG